MSESAYLTRAREFMGDPLMFNRENAIKALVHLLTQVRNETLDEAISKLHKRSTGFRESAESHRVGTTEHHRWYTAMIEADCCAIAVRSLKSQPPAIEG